MRKPVFGVSDKVRFKLKHTETRKEIQRLESLHPNKQITKALIRLCRCAGWSAQLLFGVSDKVRFKPAS